MSAAVGLAVASCLLVGVALALARTFRALGPARPPAEPAVRWQGRPVLSAVVVATAYSVPVLGAVAVSAVLSRQLPEPSGWFATALTWIFLFGVSTAALVAIERIARRLLPLGALLKLSLAFPDQAPRRLSIARRAASVRDLEARLHKARSQGIEDEPARAAETILTLVGALHAHDRRTRGHAERVRALTDLLADELHLSSHDRDRLRWAALLHDVGKIHVPAKILNKPGKPTAHEWELIQRHPIDGARLASPLAHWLGDWSLTIIQHHERWDGTGYPYGLEGEAISYGARIVGVADSFDAMTSARSYQRARGAAVARRELTAEAGRQFDPAVVRAFLNVSIGRVRWALGPLSWAVQVPFIGWVPRAAEGMVAASSQAAGVVGTAAGAAVIATTAAAGAGASTMAEHGTAPQPPEVGVAASAPVAAGAPTPAGGATSGPAAIGVSGRNGGSAGSGPASPRPSGPAGSEPGSAATAAPPGPADTSTPAAGNGGSPGNGKGPVNGKGAGTTTTTAASGTGSKGPGLTGDKTRAPDASVPTTIPTTAGTVKEKPGTADAPKPPTGKVDVPVPVPALTTTTTPAPTTTSTTLASVLGELGGLPQPTVPGLTPSPDPALTTVPAATDLLHGRTG